MAVRQSIGAEESGGFELFPICPVKKGRETKAMILSGREIHKHLGKEIVIEPFDEKRLNPNSYNLSCLLYTSDAADE